MYNRTLAEEPQALYTDDREATKNSRFEKYRKGKCFRGSLPLHLIGRIIEILPTISDDCTRRLGDRLEVVNHRQQHRDDEQYFEVVFHISIPTKGR